jgi:glycosyltransferase involved in cell wall biosynthesis
MACATPVLAARVGGIPEVITDGVEGLLEPVGSVEAMARRAVDLLRDAPRHQRMREAAIARARQFSTTVVVPQYEAFYQKVMAS